VDIVDDTDDAVWCQSQKRKWLGTFSASWSASMPKSAAVKNIDIAIILRVGNIGKYQYRQIRYQPSSVRNQIGVLGEIKQPAFPDRYRLNSLTTCSYIIEKKSASRETQLH